MIDKISNFLTALLILILVTALVLAGTFLSHSCHQAYEEGVRDGMYVIQEGGGDIESQESYAIEKK